MKRVNSVEFNDHLFIIIVIISLKVLAEKVHIRTMSIAQRVMLLQQGLNDRSGKTDNLMYKTFVNFEFRSKKN